MALANSARQRDQNRAQVDSPLLCSHSAPALRWGREGGIIQDPEVSFPNVTHECSIPTAKTVKRPHPDLVNHAESQLSHENQRLGGFFRLGKGEEVLNDAFAGSTSILARRQGALDLETRVTSRNLATSPRGLGITILRADLLIRYSRPDRLSKS
jgi:hypothetical protein